MTTSVDRDQLVKKLTYEVTFQHDEPYPELKSALESLVTALSEGKSPGVSPDWAAVVSEAVNLRPSH